MGIGTVNAGEGPTSRAPMRHTFDGTPRALPDTSENSMSQRPIIGVTTQTLQSIDGIPAGLPQSVVMNQRYYVPAGLAAAAGLGIGVGLGIAAARAPRKS